MIVNNLSKVLLLLIVLVQICWSRPAFENPLSNAQNLESKEVCRLKTENEENASSLSSSNQLLQLALNVIQNLAIDYIKSAKKISENLLKHPDILSSRSAKILEFKQNLTQFDGNYSVCDGLEELFDLEELYFNTTEYYLELEETALDEEDKIIVGLLRKYGSDDLIKKIMSGFEEFSLKFNKKFEDLKENLRKEEGKIGQDLLDWYQHYQTLTDIKDKIEAFTELLILFEHENE